MLTLLKGREKLSSVGVQGDPKDDILPIAYYNCVKPPLEDQKVRNEFAKYLSSRDCTETYYWIRERPEHERNALLEILVEQTLEKNAFSGDADDHISPREDRAMEFVNLPFSDEEDAFIEKFLTEGKGRVFHGAHDTVIMRKIATGKLQDVASDTGARGRRVDGVNWEVLKDGVKKGLGPRKDEEAFVA